MQRVEQGAPRLSRLVSTADYMLLCCCLWFQVLVQRHGGGLALALAADAKLGMGPQSRVSTVKISVRASQGASVCLGQPQAAAGAGGAGKEVDAAAAKGGGPSGAGPAGGSSVASRQPRATVSDLD